MARSNLIILDREKVASKVITCGDPGRVILYAKNLLEDRESIESDRNFVAFTGTYKGQRFSILQHGIGGSSAETVIGDLPTNVKLLVRIGSGEANRTEMKRGELVIPEAALKTGGVVSEIETAGYKPDVTADPELVASLRKSADSYRIKNYGGLAFSSDTFFIGRKRPPRQAVIVDMESATVLALGNLFGIKTATVLMVNNNLINDKGYALARTLTEEYRLQVGKVVLDALAQIEVSPGPNKIDKIFGTDWTPKG